MHVDEEELRRLHRREMVSLGYRIGGDYERGHEERVIARAVATLTGKEDPPYRHTHYNEEAGVCTECDAASLIAQYKGDWE